MHVHYDISGILGIAMEVMLAGIILAYVMIALQFWLRRNGERRARRALSQLFAIFILCSLCGYLPRLVPFPTWLLVALHALLFIVAWLYAAARQADVISDALRKAESNGHGDV